MNILEEVLERGGVPDKSVPNIFSFYFFVRKGISVSIDKKKLKNITPLVFVLDVDLQRKMIYCMDLLSMRKDILTKWYEVMVQYSKLGRIPAEEMKEIHTSLYKQLGIYTEKRINSKVEDKDPLTFLKWYRLSDIQHLHYIHPDYIPNFLTLQGAWNNPLVKTQES